MALNASQIHILRLCADLLQQLTTFLPVFSPHLQSVCYRQDNFSVGRSDHYTLLLRALWNLTKLLIKAPSSLRGWLLPASALIAHYLPTPQPCKLVAVCSEALPVPPTVPEPTSALCCCLSPSPPAGLPILWELCPSHARLGICCVLLLEH